jgi:hypothetical protein
LLEPLQRQPTVSRDFFTTGIDQVEVGSRVALDPAIAHHHPEHAAHVAQCVVGNGGRATGHDPREHAIDVDRQHIGWRDRPQHRIDVPAEHARDDFGELVAWLDTPREPEFASRDRCVHPILSFEAVGFGVGKPREKRREPSEPHNKPHRVRALRCNALGQPRTKRPYATTG